MIAWGIAVISVDKFLENRFAGSLEEIDYYKNLWRLYQASNLADPHFTQELTSGDDGCFWSRVWEMVLYRHILTLTKAISSTAAGPDFRAQIGGQPVYIEAITPAPTGLPADWLTPPRRGEVRVGSFPHEAMLLRWTAALKEKRNQLERHRKSGLIKDGIPTVIAVNSCRLSLLPEEIGITQLPFAVEAVFPVGPLAVPVNVNTGEFGESYQSVRFSIPSQRGSPVPTDSFMNLDYAGVSAVLGCATCHVSGSSLPMVVVHNPLARNPLPLGIRVHRTAGWR
jgi:type I restriction enzyme S subunit